MNFKYTYKVTNKFWTVNRLDIFICRIGENS